MKTIVIKIPEEKIGDKLESILRRIVCPFSSIINDGDYLHVKVLTSKVNEILQLSGIFKD